MSKKLALIALGGFVLGAACLGAAVSVGGGSVLSHLDDLDFGGWDGPRCNVALAGHDDTRELDWNDSDQVQLEIPASVHYKRGEGDKLVLKGDAALLPLVRLERKGRIRFNCHVRHTGDISVTLPGRDFKSYSVKGAGDVTLEGIDQPSLEINVAGHSDLTASGKTDRLEYNMAGAGDAKLGGLEAQRAEVTIAGHGNTEINASDSLEVTIAGQGDVKLITEPHHIETSIFGAGEIIHPNGDVSRTHGAGHSSHGDEDSSEPPSPPEPPESPPPPKPPAKGI
jgi:hypothetical protein